VRARLLLALPAVLLLAALAGPAAAQTGPSNVTVIHGLPGVFADVYVNDEVAIDNFDPAEITDPIPLPAGTYQIDITEANATDNSAPLLSGSATVPAGANLTLIAHLNGQGQPTLTPFQNDVSTVAAGQGRLTVRHTAAGPPVDILVNSAPAFRNLENGEQASTTLAAGTVSAGVAPAGSTSTVLGPADVQLGEGVHTIAYAVGSVEEDTLDLLVQTIEDLESSPGGVPSGTGGAASTGLPPVAMVAIAAAGLMAVVSAGRLVVLRSRR
jgi:uncharacterized protein DUF4397